jgi:hypothetical protein
MKTKFLLIAVLAFVFCSAIQAQTIPNYVPSNGLVGWWPFNGNANDESGNGNNGTVNGATLSTDRFGGSNNSYNFDGINDYIEVPNIAVQGNAERTLSAWILTYYNPIWSTGEMVISTGSGSNEQNATFNIRLDNQSQFAGFMGFVNDYYPTGNVILNDSIWHHLVLTYKNDTLKFYVDGQFEKLNYQPGLSTNGQSNFFGKSNDFNAHAQAFWIGELDDIGMWNRALTSAEITTLFTGEPINPPTACNPLPSNLQNGLVGYWPFCGNANDESGNGNDGTVNGANLTEDRFGVANAAYDFDGVDDFIQTNLLGFVGKQTRSFSFWVATNSSEHQAPIDFYGGTGNAFSIVLNNPCPGVGVDCAFGVSMKGNQNLINGNWHHCVLVYDSLIHNTISDVAIFIDGEFQPNVTCSALDPNGEINNTNSTNIVFGKTVSNVRYTDGQIDDIAIYNRALTIEEIQQLYTINACTFTIYDTVTVTQTVYDTVSVSVSTTDTLIINTLITQVQPAQENTFLVYPNPAGSQITINNGNVSILGGYTMRITNSAGQEVYNQNITQTEVTLDLSNWGGNGLYVMYVVDPQGEIIAVKQIVLQ